MKICSACSLEKDRSEYSVNRANPDGLDYFCKNCKSKKAKTRRRKTKIYLSVKDGFDPNSVDYYIISKCEVCDDQFYPMRLSHKRCVKCSNIVRDIQSHLSLSRSTKFRTPKCSVNQAVEIAKALLTSHKCTYCNISYTSDNAKSPDHIVPLVNGGTHDIGNINICCLQCNLSKRDMLLDTWVHLCRNVANNIKL